MEKYYLAVDIGASGGRHILGTVRDGKMELKEIHRFQNGIVERNGRRCWDTEYLFHEILEGMKKCCEHGMVPVSVGIDTWAVDYVLLDREDKEMGEAFSYRDSRTEGMDTLVYGQITEEELYRRTGIQKQPFNTIYQLMADQEKVPEKLATAASLLMIPDYFHFRLTGVKSTEYTNASTTQLVDVKTGKWDEQLIVKLGLPGYIFQKIRQPGTFLGHLLPEIQKQVGYDCRVVLPGTHDTASAVAAVPSLEENPLYISSGTWSLMGTELTEAICTKESRKMNMTNEGGCSGKIRYLKNIMGLWMIQLVKRELGEGYTFDKLCRLAAECTGCTSVIDVNDSRFLAPKHMIQAIQDTCRETGQTIPQTPGELAAVVYNSLAVCYGKSVREIELMTGQQNRQER